MKNQKAVRIFDSDFLEFFSHINPWQIALFWGAVNIFLIFSTVTASVNTGNKAVYIPVSFVAGLFFWTLAEYSLHRWLFHFKPKTPLQERISFISHGVHHEQPMVKTRSRYNARQ